MGSKSKGKQSSSSQNVSNNQGVSSGVNMNYGVNQSGNFGTNRSSNYGMSKGSSGSSNSSSSQSNQSVWGPQTSYLTDVYGGAQDAFDNAQGQINDLQPQVQDQLGSALGQAQGGFGDQIGGGFAAGLQNQIGPNSYVDALKGDMMNDAAKLKAQNLGALDARAAAAGMSGSSGYRNQVTDMAENVDESTLAAMNNLGYQSFNQGIQNQMNLANMMDQNQQAGLGNLQNIQQGAMNQFNPAMMGQQSAALYGQTIGGPTTLTNSTSQSSGQSASSNNSMNTGSSFGQNMGFSNGMNMGMGMNGSTNIGNSFGSSTGQGSSNSTSIDPGFAAAGIGAISDARLKENIKHVEQIDGINMYTWDWKDEALSSPMSYGVIAQEVAETHPEAVVTGDHGYMMVDYSKLGRAGEAALSRMEG